MDNLYNKLRDKLRQEQPLPESYTWENMGENIIHRMNGETVGKQWFLYKYLSIGLIAAIAVSIFYFSNNTKSSDKTLTENHIKNKDIITNKDQSTLSNIHNKVVELEEKNSNSKEKLEANQISFVEENTGNLEKLNQTFDNERIKDNESLTGNNQAKASTQRSTESEMRSSTKQNDLGLNKSSFTETQALRNSELSSNNLPLKTSLQNTPSQTDQVHKADNNKNNKAIETTSTAFIFPMPELNVLNIETLESNRNEALHTLFDGKSFEIIPSKSTQRFSFEFGAGLSYFNPQISGPNLNLVDRQVSEHGLTSYNAVINFSYDLGSQWTLISGVSYHNFSSRLEFFQSRDTFIIKENYLVERNINTISGEVTEIKKDISIPSTTWKSAHIHNNYSFISVPLILQRNFKTSKNLVFGVGFGTQYNRLSKVSGQSIQADEAFSVYDLTEVNNLNFVKNSWDLVMTTQFRYKLTDRLYGSLRLNFNYGLTNLRADEGIGFDGLKYGSLIGLGVKL